ncbi:hypothetical protein D9M68_369870 [compost metagenome]
MQPEALHVADIELVLLQVGGDQLGDHRADVLEHLAAFLHEQLVAGAHALFRGAVEEAEVVADVVGELGQQLGADHLELVPGGGLVGTLDDHRGGGVAEDEVAVAVAEVQVAGTDFRVDHQDRAGLAGLYRVGRGLDAESGRGAGDVHVVAEALDAERGLHFDGDGRVGALQVGAGDYHAVDIGRGPAGALQGLLRGGHGHFAEDAPLVIGALRNSRRHALGIEDAVLVHHEAALDAGGFLDEGHAGFSQGLDLATLDGGGVLRVEGLHVGIEGGHQLFVGNAVGRGVQAGATDHDIVHGRSSRHWAARSNGRFRQSAAGRATRPAAENGRPAGRDETAKSGWKSSHERPSPRPALAPRISR